MPQSRQFLQPIAITGACAPATPMAIVLCMTGGMP
jgi:hypothetical protein